MNEKYESLFTPWKIGDVEIKNRIVMTSMGGTSIFGWMEPNHFDEEAAKFLLDKANNEVGLVLPGIAPIKDIILGKWLYQGKYKYKKLKIFMDEFHKTGSKMFVQLTAGFGRTLALNSLMVKALKNKALGTLLKPVLNVSYLNASCSDTPNRWDNSIKSRILTKKEIDKMVEAFAKTAKLCKEAGVDGIEVHAVHEGYLLDQFTMKYTNKRNDEYGGSFENRYRFPVEIVKAIKRECGNDFPVSLRFSVISKTKGFQEGALPGEEYTEVGRDMEEAIKAAKYLEEAGYDMLNCDNGTYDAWYWAHPPGYMPTNCNLKEVEEIKKHVSIPVVCAGRMTPEVASEGIKDGKLDAMGVARQFLCDSQWVRKLKEDKLDDIRPCICCHNGCFNMAHYNGVANDQSLKDNAGMARCALNPETMQSKKYYIRKTNNSKRVAIIGGGIGGMEAARVLSLRGHKVTLIEKHDYLGGVFVAASNFSFKEKDKELIQYYIKTMKDLKVEVIFNRGIKDLNELYDFDEVIVATGSKSRCLHVPGGELAIDAVEYLSGDNKLGHKVCIIGGGLTGCEIALELHKQGYEPIIVEMKNDLIAVRGVCLANSSYLRDYFKLHNVEVHLNTTVDSLYKDHVVVCDKDGNKQNIQCDNVINCIGYIPAPLFKASKHVHLVGDCSSVGNLRTVIWQAYKVAMKI